MKINKVLMMAALLLTLVLIIAGCGDTKKDKRQTNSPETETSESEGQAKEFSDKKDESLAADEQSVADKSAEDEGLEEEEPKEEKPEEEPAVQESPTKVEAIPGQHRDPNRKVVVIDPGHQRKGNSTKEPNGPGSATMKARVTQGATGVATKVPEYVMNLEVSLLLQTELENRGYTVYMTRTTHDVDISNMERAQYATTVGADIAVRIHGNGSSNQSVSGAECYAPSASNPYVSHLSNASMILSQQILNAYCAATGFKNRGVFASDTMTGINWSSVPVTIVEMGYMSNPSDDRNMQDSTMRNNMIQGIANGIDAYFGL